MIRIKSEDEIFKIRKSCILLAETFLKLKEITKQGVTTKELDNFARKYIESHGGKPAFLGYMNYPASLCVSINNEVIHGIPGKRKLKNGDIVSLDLGINLNGYFSDSAITVPIGDLPEKKLELIRVTEEALYKGIEKAVAGKRISDISYAVFNHAKKYGYGVVRQYCGHGVGLAPHEDPQITNYPSSGPNPKLKEGMVIAIEPMITMGTWEVKVLSDQWTVVTADGKDAAHFEHTIAINHGKAEILTRLPD